MKVSYQFINKEIMTCLKMVFLKQFLDQIGFSDKITECTFLLQSTSNCVCKIATLLESVICSVWCGVTQFIYTEFTDSERTLVKKIERKSVPMQDTCKCFFSVIYLYRLFYGKKKTKKRLSALRWRTFAINVYFRKINGNITLMITLTKKRLRWFTHLWNYPINLPLIS